MTELLQGTPFFYEWGFKKVPGKNSLTGHNAVFPINNEFLWEKLWIFTTIIASPLTQSTIFLIYIKKTSMKQNNKKNMLF